MREIIYDIFLLIYFLWLAISDKIKYTLWVNFTCVELYYMRIYAERDQMEKNHVYVWFIFFIMLMYYFTSDMEYFK